MVIGVLKTRAVFHTTMDVTASSVGRLLVHHQVLPREMDERIWLSSSSGPLSSLDLLPWLRDAWERAAASPALQGSRRRTARRTAEALAWHQERGTCCTWGVPGVPPPVAETWIGSRLVWWPRGIPTRDRVGIVSSRLGRRVDLRPTWFAALRAVCRSLDPARHLLVTAKGVTTDPYLRRCSRLFQLPLLVLEPGSEREPLGRWFTRRLAKRHDAKRSVEEPWVAMFSPSLTEERSDGAPLRDRLIFVACDQLFACHVRPRGHIRHLLERRLKGCGEGAAVEVALAVGALLATSSVERELVAAGASVFPVAESVVAWSPPRRLPPGLEPTGNASKFDVWPATRLDALTHGSEYLIHCTRAPGGPWPDESVDDYLDQLILGNTVSDRSAFAALVRIASQQRLIASASSIHGNSPVVCFTAVPLLELPRLRTYRPHRVRWDFEPYGIGVPRAWLAQRGARPVLYGDPSLWERLSAGDRPFFQARYGGTARAIDWSNEREWRHVGDVDLSQLPGDGGWCFVPTEREAERLRSWSPWPVVVLDVVRYR